MADLILAHRIMSVDHVNNASNILPPSATFAAAAVAKRDPSSETHESQSGPPSPHHHVDHVVIRLILSSASRIHRIVQSLRLSQRQKSRTTSPHPGPKSTETNGLPAGSSAVSCSVQIPNDAIPAVSNHNISSDSPTRTSGHVLLSDDDGGSEQQVNGSSSPTGNNNQLSSNTQSGLVQPKRFARQQYTFSIPGS